MTISRPQKSFRRTKISFSFKLGKGWLIAPCRHDTHPYTPTAFLHFHVQDTTKTKEIHRLFPKKPLRPRSTLSPFSCSEPKFWNSVDVKLATDQTSEDPHLNLLGEFPPPFPPPPSNRRGVNWSGNFFYILYTCRVLQPAGPFLSIEPRETVFDGMSGPTPHTRNLTATATTHGFG